MNKSNTIKEGIKMAKMTNQEIKKMAEERHIGLVQHYFGVGAAVYGKWFDFIHECDDENVIVVTNNVVWNEKSDCYMLVVGAHYALYLKTCVEIAEKNVGLCYAVKLNKRFFKPYRFSNAFEGYFFDKECETFDDLLDVAKEQDEHCHDYRLRTLDESEHLFLR